MALSATAEERFNLITRRLQAVFGGDMINAILAEGRPLKGYWGALFTIIQVSSSLIYVILFKLLQKPHRLEDASPGIARHG